MGGFPSKKGTDAMDGSGANEYEGEPKEEVDGKWSET